MAVRHEFKDSFEITTQGRDSVITFIEMPMPSARMAEQLSAIDEIIGQAISKARDTKIENAEAVKKAIAEKDNGEKLSANDVIIMLIASGVEMRRAYSAIKDYLTYSKAKLNGEFVCTGVVQDDLPLPALKEILGAYIVNFTSILS